LTLFSATQSRATPQSPIVSIEGNRAFVTVEVGSYEIVDGPGGQRVEMEHVGQRLAPGRPALPVRRYLIALPPGARAIEVNVTKKRTHALPGRYRIAPAPPLALLPDMPGWGEGMDRMQREWQTEYDTAYGSDLPVPGDVAWLAGGGSLRQYAYATVAFSPFTYYPQSGRLEVHSEVNLVITCDLPPDPESDERLRRSLSDRVADERASKLFSNYEEIADLYAAPDSPSRAPDETYDYVIITTGALQGAISASTFEEWKTTLGYGVRTVLTTDSEIVSQPGADLAERIREFLRSTYAAWGIRYVLLVGDYATVPMRICYPDPDFHVYNPGNPGLVAPGTPTDYYYADLSYPDATSWDLDGDGYPGEYGQDLPDFLPEVAVGRIPIDDPTKITYALDKMVAFEQDTGAWKSNVLHAGSILFFENQDHGDVPFIDGSTCLDSLETALMADYSITHFSEQSGLVHSAFPWLPVSEFTFTNAWRNDEHALVNWSGHGWSDSAARTIGAWDDGDGIPESDNGELQSHRMIGISSNIDDDHPSIVFAVSCNVGYPDPNPYGNLGIDLLTRPGWGASAGIVSSARPAAISGDWKNSPGGTEQICYEFNRHLISAEEMVGDALYYGKFDATTGCGWDLVYEYMNLYNFNLFGDPSLDVRGTPVVGLPDAGEPTDGTLDLRVTAPNPFSSAAVIRLFVSEAGPVQVTVFDVRGRAVATLADDALPRGEHVLSWDGTDGRCHRVAPGVYTVDRQRGGVRAIQRLVLLN
jgi:hypothetical protein